MRYRRLIERARGRLCWLRGHEWAPIMMQIGDLPATMHGAICVHCLAPADQTVAREIETITTEDADRARRAVFERAISPPTPFEYQAYAVFREQANAVRPNRRGDALPPPPPPKPGQGAR